MQLECYISVFFNQHNLFIIVHKGDEQWLWLWSDDKENPDIIQGPTYVVVNATLGNTPAFYRYTSKWSEKFRKIGANYRL